MVPMPDGVPWQMRQILERPDVMYFGACLVNAPRAWTRAGPTWYVPTIGWLCWGPGVSEWGTTLGLAELATSPEPKPKWHATAWVLADLSSMVLPIESAAIEADHMSEVRELADRVQDATGA